MEPSNDKDDDIIKHKEPILFWRGHTLKTMKDMQYRIDRCSIVWSACGLEKLYLIGVMQHACEDCCPVVQGRSKIRKFNMLYLYKGNETLHVQMASNDVANLDDSYVTLLVVEE